MNDFLGIIGGVGPLATAYFYELITERTKALKDQDHINMVIFSHATIPDRTDYILDHSKENPFQDLKDDVIKLTNMGAKMIFIPCNTACYFHDELVKLTDVPILNMIEDTIIYLKKHQIDNVGILATTGTISSHLYQDMCNKYGINYFLLDDKGQEKVMHIIYENVKKGKDIDCDVWEEILNYNPKIDYYILGCTELSILKKMLKLDNHFIDPLEVESDIIIDYFGKEKNF